MSKMGDKPFVMYCCIQWRQKDIHHGNSSSFDQTMDLSKRWREQTKGDCPLLHMVDKAIMDGEQCS